MIAVDKMIDRWKAKRQNCEYILLTSHIFFIKLLYYTITNEWYWYNLIYYKTLYLTYHFHQIFLFFVLCKHILPRHRRLQVDGPLRIQQSLDRKKERIGNLKPHISKTYLVIIARFPFLKYLAFSLSHYLYIRISMLCFWWLL